MSTVRHDGPMPIIPPLGTDLQDSHVLFMAPEKPAKPGKNAEEASKESQEDKLTDVSANEGQAQPPSPRGKDNEPQRFLSDEEWRQVAAGLGAVRDAESDTPVRPTSWLWPPKGLPPGLYRDVVSERAKSHGRYHVLNNVRAALMVLQIMLGAALTALGSLSPATNGTAITVLAACNTVDAGLLALLHNSGLPERYRSDRDEFALVEDHLKEILEGRLVGAREGVADTLAACFARFQAARETVRRNLPTVYSPGVGAQGGGAPGKGAKAQGHK